MRSTFSWRGFLSFFMTIQLLGFYGISRAEALLSVSSSFSIRKFFSTSGGGGGCQSKAVKYVSTSCPTGYTETGRLTATTTASEPGTGLYCRKYKGSGSLDSWETWVGKFTYGVLGRALFTDGSLLLIGTMSECLWSTSTGLPRTDGAEYPTLSLAESEIWSLSGKAFWGGCATSSAGCGGPDKVIRCVQD